MSTDRCFACGGSMRNVRERAAVRIGQRSADVEVERFRCVNCDEVLYTPEQMNAAQQAASEEIRRVDGLLTSHQIVAIRRKYGLSQVQLERLLGVGPKTVVRWERGTVFQNRATDELLRVLDTFPDVVAYLARRHGVELTVAPQRIVVADPWLGPIAEVVGGFRARFRQHRPDLSRPAAFTRSIDPALQERAVRLVDAFQECPSEAIV